MTGTLQTKGSKFYAVLNFKNESGQRVQKWINLHLPVRGNRRRAEEMLHDLIEEYQGIESVAPMNTLLSKHIEKWLEMNRARLSGTTYDQYVSILKNHIAPYFDRMGLTLSKLTAGDLEDYYMYEVSHGLNPNTVIKHHAVIRTALQWAYKHRYIKENVADLATRPERRKYRGAQPYSVEEVAQLLQLTQNEPIAVPIFLAAFYGLRRSELLGLRWSSIDFQTGWLEISTTVVKEMHGSKLVSVVRDNTTKTDYSERRLPLCQYSYQYLWNLRQRQLAQAKMCGEMYNREYMDFVCVDTMGNLLKPDFITRKFPKLLEKYQLRKIRFHDLRHSCATIMLYLGYTLKDIQTWLGHSNYNFTADTYIHSAPSSHQAMASSLAAHLPSVQPTLFPYVKKADR